MKTGTKVIHPHSGLTVEITGSRSCHGGRGRKITVHRVTGGEHFSPRELKLA